MGEMMNNKGIFFTFIVFLLALAVIFAGSAINQAKTQQKENIIEETAFKTVNSRFENIYGEIFTIKTGYAGRQQARILPFEYNAGNTGSEGWIEIEQKIPQDEEIIDETYDALNLYSIFISDKQNNPDITTTATAAKNTDWGNLVDDPLRYVALPQCFSYDPAPPYEGGVIRNFLKEDGLQDASPQCPPGASDITNIDNLEVNITITEAMKIKWLEGGGDLESLPNNQPSGPNPYVKIHISVPNCISFPQPTDNCQVSATPPYTETTIAANLSPAKNNWAGLKLDNGTLVKFFVFSDEYLTSEPPAIFVMDYNPSLNNPITVNSKITFKNKIDNMRFGAFDFEVSKPGFDNLKRGS